MGKIILVTGGSRSGKSAFAENMIKEQEKKVLYVATSIPYDEEMKDRVRKHRERRPAHWETFEGYKDFQHEFKSLNHYDFILLDCVTIMVSNLMFDYSGESLESMTKDDINRMESWIIEQVDEFIESASPHCESLIMVTNEVGYGIVPENKLSRVFRDIAGRVNQYIAKKAQEVYLVVCGVDLKIK